MKATEKLKPATTEEKKALAKAGMATATALWMRVGEKGVEDVADSIQAASGVRISPARLETLLADQLLFEMGAQEGSWFSHNSGLLVAGMVVLALIVLLVRVFTPGEVVIVTVRDLPPYHLITPADVDTVRARPRHRAFRAHGQVAGRYTMTAVPQGAQLRSDHVSPFQLSGEALREVSPWPVMIFPVTPPTSVYAVPNTRVHFFFTPAETDTAASLLRLRDAFIIASLDGETARIVAAVRGDSLTGSSEYEDLLRRQARGEQISILHPSHRQ